MDGQRSLIKEPLAPAREPLCLAGGGALGELVRAFDWSATPVGAVAHWPQRLRAAVGVCLNSLFPAIIWWGREHWTIAYNDAFQAILGPAEPARWLGRSGCVDWYGNWDSVQSLIERAVATGAAATLEDVLLASDRKSRRGDRYFTVSCSPITGENGEVSGTFCTFNETTGRVVADRRLATLRNLSASLSGCQTDDDVCVTSARVLAANARDVPFCLIYDVDRAGGQACLAAASGAEPRTSLAPVFIDLAGRHTVWPLGEVCRSGQSELVRNLAGPSSQLPAGARPEGVDAALVVSIPSGGEWPPARVMIAGLSPGSVLDDQYRGFIELAAGQIGAAMMLAGSATHAARSQMQDSGSDQPAARADLNVDPDVQSRARTLERKPGIEAAGVDPRERLEFLKREAELALRESEQRFVRFMRHLPGLAWIKDLEGRYVYANDAAEKAFRTKRSALYGKTDQEVFPPEVAAQFRDNDRQALASETGIQTIETLEHEDGLVHHSIVSKFPIAGSDDRPAFVGGVAFDITDLIRAEESIRESEERFRGLAEAMPQMVYVLTPAGEVEYVNQRWRDFTGLSHADDAGMRQVVHPDDYPLMTERWRDAAARGAPYEAEIRIQRAADRVYRWFLTRALPIRSAGGVVIKWFGTCTDIDGQKRAEQGQHILAEAGRLLTSSLDYQTTLANVCKLVVPIMADWCSLDLVGDDGHVQHLEVAHTDPAKLELAREYRRLYPARPHDRIGLMRVFRTGQPEFFAEVSDQHLVMGARDEEELRRLRELGIRSVMIVPITARGRALGALTLVMAESARRYSEDDLHLALSLGSRAALAIDSARLFEQLKTNDRRKDEFLAMLAHELRNPLAAIDNAVSLLSVPNPSQIDWSVDVIGRHVRHLARMIDDLLDVSRITRGKIQLRTRTIDAYPVLEGAIESVRPLFEERKHRLNTSLAPDLMLQADPTRLEQIVANLLSNAAKYTESPGQIWLQADREENEIVIRVRDTGVGIPPDQLPGVFELFVQGDRSLERSAGGLGIGLTLVQKLTELHGGTVIATSEGLGKGSEFTVRLPAAKQPLFDVARPVTKPESASKRPARVLVVDDNVDLARGLGRLLEIQGHDVLVVHDGAAGLDKATEWHPEFVLLDIGLPGMDGYQVAALLKQQPDTKDAVVIGISGYGQDEDRRRSRQAGFDHHLVKPISSEDLIQVLQRGNPQWAASRR
jgi:PAS domain S-box-containing protein